MAAACGVPPMLRDRVKTYTLAESGGNSWAVHDNADGQSYRPASEAEAAALARRLIAEGHDIDAGLMMINDRNWPRLHLTAATVFDPPTNVCAGSAVLADADRQVACIYNTGKPNCSNGYPQRIQATARLVADLDGTAATAPPAEPPPPPRGQMRDLLHPSDQPEPFELIQVLPPPPKKEAKQ